MFKLLQIWNLKLKTLCCSLHSGIKDTGARPQARVLDVINPLEGHDMGPIQYLLETDDRKMLTRSYHQLISTEERAAAPGIEQ